jgi:DNA-binding transcriptional LysR family regulator
MAALLLEEGLLALQDRHPGLALELLTGNRPLDVARGEADLAIRLAPVRGAGLVARCVARSALALVASRAYLRARGPVDELAGHDVILPSGELARLPEVRWLAEVPGVRIAFRSNSMPALVAATRAGRGIAPLGVVWEGPDLAVVRRLDDFPARPIWLVAREGDARRPAVEVVGQEIAAMLGRRFSP